MADLKDLQIEKQINIILTGNTEYDPHLGRQYIPARKVVEIKADLLTAFNACLVELNQGNKVAAYKLRLQEIDPNKSYFLVLPKECDNISDIEDLVNLCRQFTEEHKEGKGTIGLLSKGLEISEDRNGMVIESLMDAVRNEVERALSNGQAEQMAAIDGAMERGAKSVMEIEQRIINQRAVFNKAVDQVLHALDRVGTKLSEKYYIVDKSSLKK